MRIRTSQQKRAQAAAGAEGLTMSQSSGQRVALLRRLKK
jgi:hypothetical protein